MFKNILGTTQKKRLDECYYDADDSLIRFENPQKHDRAQEFSFVNSQDLRVTYPGDVVYIIENHWLEKWITFCNMEDTPDNNINKYHPGKINNSGLIDIYGRFNEHLIVKEDYRPINSYIWQFLFTKYGGGPVILFYVPKDCTEKQYKKGSWIKTIINIIPEIITVVYPTSDPIKKEYINLTELVIERNKMLEQLEIEKEENKKQLEAQKLIKDLEEEQLQLNNKSNELQLEINNETTNIIANELFLSNEIHKELDHAKEIEQEELNLVVTNIAHMFQLNSEDTHRKQLMNIKHRNVKQQNVIIFIFIYYN